jgi:hypothetical protein
MANSTKLPGTFNCCVGRGETTAWKKSVRRSLRRRNRQLVHTEDFDALLLPNDIATLWDAPGDGKKFITGVELEAMDPAEVRRYTSK